MAQGWKISTLLTIPIWETKPGKNPAIVKLMVYIHTQKFNQVQIRMAALYVKYYATWQT